MNSNESADVQPRNPFDARPTQPEEQLFDESKDQHVGIIIGKGLISAYRADEQADRFLAIPGDDVQVTVPTAGTPPKGVSETFTVVDVYESKMSEYDSQFVFVPIQTLQNLRGMIEPSTGIGHVTSIQIKLKNEADGELVRDKLRAAFKGELYGVYTWQDKQGSLLTAVALEKSILNILLFLIIAVAGFGILAIFYMIVVEKTRDIGILKSLGASRRRHHGHLSWLWLVAWRRRRGRGYGTRPVVCNLHQRSPRPAGVDHWHQGLRPIDLLLLQDSHDRRAAYRRLDRGRLGRYRRACQCASSTPRRPAPPS